MDLLVVSRGSAVFGPSRGGADTLALRHARLMAREGLQVAFVGNPGPGGESKVQVVPVTRGDVLEYQAGRPRAIALSYMVNQLVRLAAATRVGLRVVKSEHPEAVLSNASLTTILLRLRHPTVPVIYYLHDGLFAHRSGRGIMDRLVRFGWNDIMERIAVKLATHVFCASQVIANELQAQGVPAHKLCVMVPAAPSPEELRAPSAAPRLPSPAGLIGRPFLLSVGQQSGRKRFDLLVESMNHLSDGFRLVVVGDGPYHAEYVRQAQELGLGDRVHLLTQVTDPELRELYAAATLYVLVSENEGFPITVSEALASGCPSLLVSPSASAPEGAAEGRLTLLERIPTPVELAAAIREMWPRAIAARWAPSPRVEAPGESKKATARVDAAISQHYLRLLSQWAGRSQRSVADALAGRVSSAPIDQSHESG